MNCKACNNQLKDKDLFLLPDKTFNNLCKSCLLLVEEDLKNYDSALPSDIDIDLYTLQVLMMGEMEDR